jgi:hypothetical protein
MCDCPPGNQKEASVRTGDYRRVIEEENIQVLKNDGVCCIIPSSYKTDTPAPSTHLPTGGMSDGSGNCVITVRSPDTVRPSQHLTSRYLRPSVQAPVTARNQPSSNLTARIRQCIVAASVQPAWYRPPALLPCPTPIVTYRPQVPRAPNPCYQTGVRRVDYRSPLR